MNSFYGHKHSPELKAARSRQYSGTGNPRYGKKHGRATRDAISKARSGKCVGKDNPNFGKPRPLSVRQSISATRIARGVAKGAANPNWRGGAEWGTELLKLKRKPSWLDAWAAGILDGEGCISVARSGRYFRLNVTIGQSGKRRPIMLSVLCRFYGGSLPRPILEAKKLPRHRWEVATLRAEKFLLQVAPFVVQKRKQCLVALAYRSELKNHRLRSEGRRKLHRHYYSMLRRLKERFNGYRDLV